MILPRDEPRCISHFLHSTPWQGAWSAWRGGGSPEEFWYLCEARAEGFGGDVFVDYYGVLVFAVWKRDRQS